MGKVLVSAKIENLADSFSVRKGQLAESEVRRVEVTDALIDTGAFGLLMPTRMIEKLGLDPGPDAHFSDDLRDDPDDDL